VVKAALQIDALAPCNTGATADATAEQQQNAPATADAGAVAGAAAGKNNPDTVAATQLLFCSFQLPLKHVPAAASLMEYSSMAPQGGSVSQ